MIQQLLLKLHPNIQFPTITRPEPFVPPSHPTPPGRPPPPDIGDNDTSVAANLGDSYLYYIFLFSVFLLNLCLILLMK